MLGEVASDITGAMTPLGETSQEAVGECEACGITLYLGEWHEKRGEDELERWCLPCTRRIDSDELTDDQLEDYERQEERYDQE